MIILQASLDQQIHTLSRAEWAHTSVNLFITCLVLYLNFKNNQLWEVGVPY